MIVADEGAGRGFDFHADSGAIPGHGSFSTVCLTAAAAVTVVLVVLVDDSLRMGLVSDLAYLFGWNGVHSDPSFAGVSVAADDRES